MEGAAADPVIKKKKSRFRYDFVKVRVWVGEHYYVLSRYLVACALVATRVRPSNLCQKDGRLVCLPAEQYPPLPCSAQIAYKDAIRISLELKKKLVDSNQLDISQHEFESSLVEVSGWALGAEWVGGRTRARRGGSVCTIEPSLTGAGRRFIACRYWSCLVTARRTSRAFEC